MSEGLSPTSDAHKRVVFVTPQMRNGGAEQVLADIANGLARAGWDVEVISIFHAADTSYLDARIRTRFILDSRETAQSGGTLLHKLARRIRIVRRLYPALKSAPASSSIIGFLEPVAHYLWFFRLFGGPRYLLSLHTYETIYFRDMWRKPLRHWIETMLLGVACRAADFVTLPSEGCAEDLIENFDVPAAKVRTMQNPFDLEKVRRLAAMASERYPVPEGVTVFVHVARLVEQKNHKLMVEACRHLRAKFEDFVVLVCGQGPEQAALEAQIAGAGLEKHVRLLGHRNNPYPLMAQARGVLLSSKYESFPLVLVEGMVCGAPPICTDCPSGLKDVLSGGAGLLVPLDRPDVFADTMLRLIRDDALHKALCESGLAKAETYSADNAIRLWSALLAEAKTVTVQRVGV